MTSVPSQAPGLPGPAGRDKSVLMEVGRLASRVQELKSKFRWQTDTARPVCRLPAVQARAASPVP